MKGLAGGRRQSSTYSMAVQFVKLFRLDLEGFFGGSLNPNEKKLIYVRYVRSITLHEIEKSGLA